MFTWKVKKASIVADCVCFQIEKDIFSFPGSSLVSVESEVLMLLFVWKIGGWRDTRPIRCVVGSQFCVVQQLSQWWSGIRCNMAQ